MEPLEIYCDESGFTGENLLNRDQRFFAYGTVAIKHDEARDLVARTISDYRLQGQELKGKNLLSHSRGRKAALSLIDQLGSRSQVAIVHKEFALACKLFEYAFEPLVSDVTMGLYAVDFHRFIANLLYYSSVNHHPRARELSERFEKAVRGDTGPLSDYLSVHSPNDGDAIEAVIAFCIYHRDTILRELAETQSTLKWILDVTGTALHSLLITWGRRAETLKVTCDESGPLQQATEIFDEWVGRNDKPSIQLGDRQIQLGFNLAAPVAFAKSHQTPGIQLADVMASVAVAAMDRTDRSVDDLRRQLFKAGMVHPDSVLPFAEYADIDHPQPKLNALILAELVRRSEHNESLTNGLMEFVVISSRQLGLPLPAISLG